MKKYSVMKIDEYRKRFDKSTQSILVPNGWGNGEVSGQLVISTPDELTPNRDRPLLVTIETFDVPEGSHPSEWQRIIDERIKVGEVQKGSSTHGRKFR